MCADCAFSAVLSAHRLLLQKTIGKSAKEIKEQFK